MKYAPYRRNRELTKTKKSGFPKELLFFDTETKPFYLDNDHWENRFYLGVAIYVKLDKHHKISKRVIHRFTSPLDFLYILALYSHRKKRLLVFAHNATFDVTTLNLPALFSELGVEHNYPIINGKAFIWHVQTGTGSIQFLDTMNYAGTSLKQLGHDLGKEKTEIDFNSCTDEQLFNYCQNDVEICELFILKFIDFCIQNNMGEFRLTIASQAFTAFRHRFMPVAPTIHTVDRVNEIEKYAYYGGRTEVLKLGQINHGTIYNLDVSSHYPYAMIAQRIPYRLIGYNQTPLIPALNYHLKHNYLIVECTVKTDMPCFPMRAHISTNKNYLNLEIISSYAQLRGDFKVIYPVGTYRTWLHHCEFEYALEHNLIHSIHGYVLYFSADLFSDYVHTLFDLKAKYSDESNNSFRYVTKIFLNSLYGKFGQEFHQTKNIGKIESNEVKVTYGYSQRDNISYTDVEWYGNVYRNYHTGLSTYAFPAIAGAITSFGRMALWRYSVEAGRENIFYSDTDSLFSNQTGYERLASLIQPNSIGMLELKETSENLIIYGNKDYVFSGKSTHKGISPKAIQVDENLWKDLRFEGFKKWRNRGANSAPLAGYELRKRGDLYDKGLVQADGTILPFHLLENQTSYVFPILPLRENVRGIFAQVQPYPPQVPSSFLQAD